MALGRDGGLGCRGGDSGSAYVFLYWWSAVPEAWTGNIFRALFFRSYFSRFFFWLLVRVLCLSIDCVWLVSDYGEAALSCSSC